MNTKENRKHMIVCLEKDSMFSTKRRGCSLYFEYFRKPRFSLSKKKKRNAFMKNSFQFENSSSFTEMEYESKHPEIFNF